MTILPFTGAGAAPANPSSATTVRGRFASPTAGPGSFVGTYRFERLVDQYGQAAAVGVFAGELTGPDGQRVGLDSRRHTAAAEVDDRPHERRIGIGPVDVSLLGLLVSVEAFTVAIPFDPTAGAPTDGFPDSVSELLDRMVQSSWGPDQHRPDRETPGRC
jgi:hypothetical protein